MNYPDNPDFPHWTNVSTKNQCFLENKLIIFNKMKRINSKVSNLLPFARYCLSFPRPFTYYIQSDVIWMTLREKSALQGQRVLGEPPVYRFMPKGDYARKGLCQKGTMICQKGIMPNRGCQIGRCQIGDAKRGLCQILVCQITAQPHFTSKSYL